VSYPIRRATREEQPLSHAIEGDNIETMFEGIGNKDSPVSRHIDPARIPFVLDFALQATFETAVFAEHHHRVAVIVRHKELTVCDKTIHSSTVDLSLTLGLHHTKIDYKRK